jgi:hypothetical protein
VLPDQAAEQAAAERARADALEQEQGAARGQAAALRAELGALRQQKAAAESQAKAAAEADTAAQVRLGNDRCSSLHEHLAKGIDHMPCAA